jgi:lysophospholipase L1-like esterase
VRQRSRFNLYTLFAAVVALVAGPSFSAPSANPILAPIGWVSSWGSAQIRVDPKDAIPATARGNATLRQLIRTSIGGGRVRLRLSNVFGAAPLTITGVHIARAMSADAQRIDPPTDRSVPFNGASAVTIPAGAEYVSDPVSMNLPALATLAVTIHFAEVPKVQTGHPGSRATSYFAPGDQLSAVELRGVSTVDHWYFLSALDVESELRSAAVAVVGDSIVDGHGVVSNTNTRWTDFLAERLKGAERPIAVLNVGIGSNCLVEACVGPSAVARFGRDVLERSAVRYVIILEGVNDLGMLTRDAPASAAAHHALVERMIGAYAQMTARARERGIKVIGATIMPYGASGYYHPDAANDADRKAVNAWIRTPGNVDAVVDFDALMRDPAQPQRLRKVFDSGDGLHPSPEGYRFMGGAVPLALFATRSGRARR